ncbi:unnamed protein product [Adineta steineri]|uniref:Rap-GAP domain-containing protein n=1 Tax=Adineta steineri TaxID=433720 RepID=A0A814WDZ6_9BILA|nr:unnamed protein product [Adineta steineri]CAF1200042.1 unnamed protein product [Adineta steineri]
MSQLFGRTKPNKADETIQRTKEKIIDVTKNLSDRQRYLKQLIDQLSVDDLQTFFKNSYQHIFYLFFENFSQVESNITRALSKQNQSELEYVTNLLERILTLLPTLVHQRWQAHCICNVIKRYFVVCNSPQGVARGMRLFLLWYQILGSNAVEEEHSLFKGLIRNWNQTLVGTRASGENNHTDEQPSAAFNELFRTPPDAFRWADIIPIWPKNTSDYEPTLERWLLFMLHTISDTCKRVLWDSNRESSRIEKQEECFRFLFDMFKRYYMPTLFPTFTEQNIYDLSAPITIPETVRIESDRPRRRQTCLCRTAFVTWLLPFLNEEQNRDRTLTRVPNPNLATQIALTQSTTSMGTVTGLSDYSLFSNELYHIITGSISKNQTASFQQIVNSMGPLDSNTLEIGQNVLLSTQENINFIHEIFRQSYLMSGEYGFAASHILRTVNDWIKERNLRPVFMLEPEQRSSSNDKLDDNHLRLGLNRWLQIFITQSFYLFLVRPTSQNDEQQTPQHGVNAVQPEQGTRERSLAGLVTFYKKLPQRHTPDRTTWDLILRVMLKIVRLSLQDRPPPNSNHLYIENTIKTLLFLFQSASLYVSVELWNHLSDTLSSRTMWPEVIDQWDASMRALTKDLGRLVYKVETEPIATTSIRRGVGNIGVRRTATSVPPSSLDLNSSNTQRTRTLSSDDDIDPAEQSTPQQQQQHQLNRTTINERDRVPRRRTNSDDSLTHSTATTSSSSIINRPHILASIPSNQIGEQQATMESHTSEQHSVLFSPSEPLTQQQQQHQPLTIHIAQQTPNSHMSDMSSPNHALDSPMSDDYSTASTSVLDTHSLSGIPSGDALTSNFKNNNIHAIDSRSTTVSESTSTSDHHQHISPPLSRDHHPLSQSTVDSLHSFPQDSATIDSIDTATYMHEHTYESSRLAPETAYTAWFRMLGSLGNINQIRSAEQHNRIMRTLFDIWKMLCRIHVQSKDTQHGDLYFDGPPLLIFAPWLFEAIQTLPTTHRDGKLSAYRLLCSMGVLNHDVSPPSDFLDMFLLTIYHGLLSGDEDIIYVIISSCKVDFFHRCWPSSTLLLPLFTSACYKIGQQPCLVDGKTIPKVEALTILSSLVCFPNHFEQLDVLSAKDKEYVPVTMDRTQLKRMIMSDLIKASQNDSVLESREIALCGVAIFLCEELKHQRVESPIKPFMTFIVDCLQPADSTMFAADMLRFLASYAPLFISHRDNQSGQVYTKIIDGLILSLRANIPRDVGALMRNNVRIIKSLIFALLEWILHVPTSYLQQQQTIRDDNNQDISSTIIQRTFSVLIDAYRSTNSLNDEQTVQDNELTLSQSIKLCCKFAILFLLNEHSHFPLTENESSLITTNVHEGHDWLNSSKQQTISSDDNQNLNQSDELIINSSNIQLFVIHDDFLISFIEIPNDKINELTTDNQQFISRTTLCRTIIRDLCGRYCWDNYAFNISSNSKAITRSFNNTIELTLPTKSTYEVEETTRGITVLEKFDTDQPPTHQNQPPNADILDKLLQYITSHSPELAFYSDRTLTDVSPTPTLISSHDEKAIIRMITEQETAEKEYDLSLSGKTERRIENPIPLPRNDRFALCRSHITQLGLMMFENRQNIDLLNTSKTNCDQLLRELKNLDTLDCRETHKIAVIYIGYGQEDKTSIFNNTHGSTNYEEFLTHLGWQVELSKHTGFRGGLHPLANTYSIYYADALVEIMYHVATMIDGSTDEDRLRKKTRHIGNDEVQIIWTEHYHEYEKSIIASAFGDVLIVIHPLPNGLYRIKIDKTSQTTNFGPLFDGAIVDKLILPELVRATAVNASRARRTTLNNHCEFYEERYRIINSIIRTHKKETTYEEFLAKSFTPLATKTLAHQTDEATKSTNTQNERRDGLSNIVTNSNSNIPPSGQKTRQTTRNFPFLTPNNTVPTPTTRR